MPEPKITLRDPAFDFSASTPHWAPSLEFSYLFNAQSMLFPPVERFLNRVMMMARKEITGSDRRSVKLRDNIDQFIQQEGIHFKIHTDYNEMLTRRFPKLPEFEAQMDAEYRDFLKTKDMRWLTAYCEAFEMLGPVFAHVWLDGIDDLFEGADPTVAAMWRWHICEEFEHRNVAFDTYDRLYGNYLYRVRMLKVSRMHQGGYIKRVLDYMFEVENEGKSPEQIAASQAELAAIFERMATLAKRRITRALLPFYSPDRVPAPKNFAASILGVERDYVPLAA